MNADTNHKTELTNALNSLKIKKKENLKPTDTFNLKDSNLIKNPPVLKNLSSSCRIDLRTLYKLQSVIKSGNEAKNINNLIDMMLEEYIAKLPNDQKIRYNTLLNFFENKKPSSEWVEPK